MDNPADGYSDDLAASPGQPQHEKTILITGVGGFWGARLAEALNDNESYHVIGIDDEPPEIPISGLDFIHADVRNPLLGELFRSEQVDTVCHLAFQDSDRPNDTAYDYNVRGTRHVFEACVESGVRRIILKSSTSVYGAQPGFAAFLNEEQPLMGSLTNGTVRDLVEIEASCQEFLAREQGVILTVLRFANILGPKSTTPLTRLLEEPLTLRLLGFDPMWQIIHENDVISALVHTVEHEIPGVFNLAADEPLPLSKLMALAGTTGVPVIHWLAYWGYGTFGRQTARYLPFDPDYLRYSLVADLAKMHTTLGFIPQYTAEESLREFAGMHRSGRLLPESRSLTLDEERLRDTIERRRRIRKQKSADLSEQLEEQTNE
jgi:UDP-glucose 4-epimerase